MTKLALLFVLLIQIGACQMLEDRKESGKLHNITRMEQDLMSRSDAASQQAAADALLLAYQDYIDAHPSDTISADLLFKRAELLTRLGRIPEAIADYDRIYREFAHYSQHPMSIFMQALAYDNILEDAKGAQLKYELFLKEYPDHRLSQDVRFALDHAGKTPEEMVKEFMKQEEGMDSTATETDH